MSQSRNDDPRTKPRREESAAPASSLTDAVVAALAHASKPPPDPSGWSDARQTNPENGSTDRDAEPKSDPPNDPVPSSGPPRPAEGAPTAKIQLDGRLAPRELAEGISVTYFGRTDVGLVREHNEDNFLVADLGPEQRGNPNGELITTLVREPGVVLAVCDGMGGAAAGEVASQMAVDTLYELLSATDPSPPDPDPQRQRERFARKLVHAIEEAGTRIFGAAKMDRSRRGMGTTSTVAGVVDQILFVGQVGDSRAYVLRGEEFALVTKDQSLVNQLIEAGQLTEEEAEAFEHSNIILQALGTTEEVAVDLTFLELRRGDRLLICSDGLSGLVHADLMKDVMMNARDLREAAQQLISMANSGGGHDNITVILAEFEGAGLREPGDDARVAYQQYPLPPDDTRPNSGLPRGTSSIRVGGAKPGADVKEGEDSVPSPPLGNRWWVVALLLLLLLMGIAAAIVFTDDGEVVTATPSSERSSGERERLFLPPPPPLGTLIIETVDRGTLDINGEEHRAVPGVPTVVSLPAGTYRLELRQGDVQIAEEAVTLSAGEHRTLHLAAPDGVLPDDEVPMPEDHLGDAPASPSSRPLGPMMPNPAR